MSQLIIAIAVVLTLPYLIGAEARAGSNSGDLRKRCVVISAPSVMESSEQRTLVQCGTEIGFLPRVEVNALKLKFGLRCLRRGVETWERLEWRPLFSVNCYSPQILEQIREGFAVSKCRNAAGLTSWMELEQRARGLRKREFAGSLFRNLRLEEVILAEAVKLNLVESIDSEKDSTRAICTWARRGPRGYEIRGPAGGATRMCAGWVNCWTSGGIRTISQATLCREEDSAGCDLSVRSAGECFRSAMFSEVEEE